jgi:hypothetical protein
MAVNENVILSVLVSLVKGDVSTIPLRSDHASWMEGLFTDYDSVDSRGIRNGHGEYTAVV